MKFTFRTKQDMALYTPMIRTIARRIVNHANSNGTEVLVLGHYDLDTLRGYATALLSAAAG